ncbi:hypothetical protein ACFX16_027517 [Malus domestica]
MTAVENSTNSSFSASIPLTDTLNLIPIASVTVQNITSMVLTKLNRHNYITWYSLFLPVLKRFKLLGLINDTNLCPSQFVCDSTGTRIFVAFSGKTLRASLSFTCSQPSCQESDDLKRTKSATSDELHGLLLSKEISLQKRKNRATASTPFHAYTAQSSPNSSHHSGFRGNY